MRFGLTAIVKRLASRSITKPLLCVTSILVLLNGPLAFAQTGGLAVDANIGAELVVDNLPKAWSINYSPDKRVFVTERSGGIIVFDQAWRKQSYKTNITDLLEGGQGGFLDLAFHPEFLSNGWIYLSYSAGTNNFNRLKVVRFKMPQTGIQISTIEDVFSLKTDKNTPVHYGGRLAFLSDNSLLISTGDGFDFREQAQVKTSHLGKILRVDDRGQPLSSNPFFDATAPENNANYVFTLGHRNPQALLVSENARIISHEHGPAGGDEINIIEAGNNYGWPIITNGRDYSGALITPFTEYEGMQQANYDWTPSIAPSGMILYKSEKFPTLYHHLVVSSLKFKQLRALQLEGNTVSKERILLADFKYRLRDIEQDNEGNILLLTDGDGNDDNGTRIYRLTKK